MKVIGLTKWAVVIACTGFLALASQVRATSLTFGDTYDLGLIICGIPAGDQYRLAYVNKLISLAPGTMNFFDPVTGQTYNRLSTGTHGSPYPTAISGQNSGGGNASSLTSLDISVGGYEYLCVKYGGQNYGTEVWDVSGLTGTVTIPEFAGADGQNQISGWTLFTPGGVPAPDGGSTVALLGAALSVIGLVRRKLS